MRKDNLPEFVMNRHLDKQMKYKDTRSHYKEKYQKMLESNSVDENINEIQGHLEHKYRVSAALTHRKPKLK